MRILRGMIVEDEAPARENLRELLATVPWLQLVGEAANGTEALELADRVEPEVVFLDVQIPEIDGIEVARQLAGDIEIVFTTAFERFAITAFELGAIDYLVKPFGADRFASALARVHDRLMRDEPRSRTRAQEVLTKGAVTRIFASKGDRIVPIPVSSILQVRARGDYAEVLCDAGSYLMHVSLSELHQRLDPQRFLRVHRSHLVNLDAVRDLLPLDDRRMRLTLRDGSELIASRAASQQLRRTIR